MAVLGRGKGSLEAIIGPMFAGKSTELIRQYRQSAGGILYKPTLDTRYDKTQVVTHNGDKAIALCMGNADMLYSHVRDTKGAKNIFIDEVQFLDENIIAVIKLLQIRGYNVAVAGLDTDYMRRPFPFKEAKLYTMFDLMREANHVNRLFSQCSVCGNSADYTARIAGGNDLVSLGAAKEYEARCDKHWEAYKA